jgi:hypothetical protein
VEFIIKHSGLFLILDEAHFLLPPRFSGNTQPTRLDWVRTQIVDRNVPVALVTTPQAIGQRVAKFQKATGYNFSQFFGRIMLNLVLPNELDKDDLLAVARIQGADIAEKFHPFIVGRAMQSEGYLMAIKAICCRARFIAQRDSHPAVTFADVELAASEVMPTSSAPAAAAPIHRSEAPPTPRRQPIAIRRGCSGEPTPSTAPPLEMHSRETSPAFEPVNQRTLSPSALA